jgi:hypothetical protein
MKLDLIFELGPKVFEFEKKCENCPMWIVGSHCYNNNNNNNWAQTCTQRTFNLF